MDAKCFNFEACANSPKIYKVCSVHNFCQTCFKTLIEFQGFDLKETRCICEKKIDISLMIEALNADKRGKFPDGVSMDLIPDQGEDYHHQSEKLQDKSKRAYISSLFLL